MEKKGSKAYGVEQTPFILPHRWTYMRHCLCMDDYVRNRLGEKDMIVSRIYYTKSGKSKQLVEMD